MRLSNIVLLGGAALALSACVVATPMPQPLPGAVITPAVPPAPTTLDAASASVARNAINAEMAKRIIGADTTPYTNCIMQNATTAELIDIAQMARGGTAGVADSVAVIIKRPATGQCIVAATRSS